MLEVVLPAPAGQPRCAGAVRRARPDPRRRAGRASPADRGPRRPCCGCGGGKGMVLDAADHDTWSAGSFFTNPVLPPTGRRAAPRGRPGWPQPDGTVKTSAAWLIEHAGFGKGYGAGPVSALHQAHAGADQPWRRHHRGPARAGPRGPRRGRARASAYPLVQRAGARRLRRSEPRSVAVGWSCWPTASPSASEADQPEQRQDEQHRADDAGDVADLGLVPAAERAAGGVDLSLRALLPITQANGDDEDRDTAQRRRRPGRPGRAPSPWSPRGGPARPGRRTRAAGRPAARTGAGRTAAARTGAGRTAAAAAVLRLPVLLP